MRKRGGKEPNMKWKLWSCSLEKRSDIGFPNIRGSAFSFWEYVKESRVPPLFKYPICNRIKYSGSSAKTPHLGEDAA